MIEQEQLEKWIEAVLIIADVEGMPDSQEIQTWPRDVTSQFPALTVGAVRAWQSAREGVSVPQGWSITPIEGGYRLFEPNGETQEVLTWSDSGLERSYARLADAFFSEQLQSAPQPEQQNGINTAAAYIEQKAENYLSEHCHTESDTNATICPGDGMDYYNGLIELAEEIRGLRKPQPSEKEKPRRDGLTLEARHWLEMADIIRSCGEGEDCMMTEWRVEECDRRGVEDDDGKPHWYPAVMYEADYFEEGVIPIGDEIIQPQPPEGE